jgi:predicted transposase YbfD/YdcC
MSRALGAARGPAEEPTFRRALALVSAGQVAVDEKSNEIPAVRELLKAFADLAGAVFTIGAMHTPHDTAQVILVRQADYVMTVKANMPTLHRQLKKKLPRAAVPAVSAVSTDHGRRACRTIKAVLAPARIEFDGSAQVAQLRRTVTKKGKKTVEVVPHQIRKRAAFDGIAAQPGHQPATPGRPGQHRRRPPPPGPRPATIQLLPTA